MFNVLLYDTSSRVYKDSKFYIFKFDENKEAFKSIKQFRLSNSEFVNILYAFDCHRDYYITNTGYYHNIVVEKYSLETEAW